MFLKLKKFNAISFSIIICILLSSMNVFAQGVITSETHLSRFEKYDIQGTFNATHKLATTYQENEAYNVIKNSFLSIDSEIDITSLSLNKGQLENLVKTILVENPDIFYLRGWSYSYDPYSGLTTKLTPKYDYSKDKIISMTSEIDSKVDQILSSVIKNGMTDFQKELAIHDYLVLNSKYDTNRLSNGSYAIESHNIYGILVNGVGVCESYAESFKLLLNKVGIESMVVISTPSMNHAWNIVNLDGEYYHVDVTWDDPTPDREGITSYRYLNLTNTEISSDHYWDTSKYPTCTSEAYSYLWNMSSPIVKDNYIYYGSSQSNSEYIYKLNQSTLNKVKITNDRSPYFAIVGDWIYYSNYSKGAKIYKINIDGSSDQLFSEIQAKNLYSKDNRIYFNEYNTNVKKYIEVEVPTIIDVTRVDLNKSSLDLVEGDTSKLVATVSPSNATNKNISWVSSKPSVATVDNQGNITAFAKGTTAITVTTEDGNFVANCIINVASKENDETEDDYTGYTKWEEKLNVSPGKEWTIKFSHSIMEDSINSDNVYVTDKDGNLYNDTISWLSSNNTITIKPKTNYKSGSAYFLYIENIKSNTGNKLSKHIKMKFTIQ